MEFAVWTYPWDLIDAGSSAVADRLFELGVTELNLATNYHHVQAFCPQNPKRRTFFARASSYFQPGEGYGTLKPIPNETMGDADWVEQIAAELSDVDISLNSWTVGVHNSSLGMSRPEFTIENAFGDNLVFGLCPSQPAVQTYLTNVIRDLAERDIFERIELETFDYFYGTGWGWHHDKFHVELGTLGEFLFGLCFCPKCRHRAVAEDIHVDQVRTTVRETIDAIVSGNLPPSTKVEGWMRSHPSVSAYTQVRERTLTELFQDFNDASGSCELGYYAGFEAPGRTWMQGADLTSLAAHVDYYTVAAYESSRREAVNNYKEIAGIAPDTPLHSGVLPAYPVVTDRATLVDIVKGLATAGTQRVSFYNYGLLPSTNIDWIGEAIKNVE